MPNYCSNLLVITSPKREAIEEFILKGKTSTQPFSFQKYVPIPITAYLSSILDGTSDYRNFAIDNWGTKWEACDSSEWSNIYKDDISDYIANISFETAWAPIDNLIENIYNNYPEINFRLEYAEPGMMFAGVVEASIENGVAQTEFNPGDDDFEATMNLFGYNMEEEDEDE